MFKKLIKTNYITTQGTSRFTRVKILKSSIYDEINLTNNTQTNNQIVNKTHSDNELLTTTKKVKKEEENKESIEIFKNKILKFSNLYSKEHLEGFYDHWTCLNKQTGRRRFEENNYLDIEIHLKNWKVFNSNKSTQTFTKNR